MKILLLICVLASGLMAQKLPKGFEVEYDKFRDETRTSFLDYPGSLTTELGFAHSGTAITSNIQSFHLHIFASRNQCYGYCFNDPELIFLIDGHRVRLESEALDDSVTFFLERSVVEKMASAKHIEFQISRFRGEWKEKSIIKIKTLLDLATVK